MLSSAYRSTLVETPSTDSGGHERICSASGSNVYWKAGGATAEFLGAIEVIVSLVYRAGQIGQNLRYLKVQTLKMMGVSVMRLYEVDANQALG